MAFVVVMLVRSRVPGRGLALVVGVGAAAVAEIVFEVGEYALVYADRFYASAYYDTVADLAATLIGGAIGAVVGVLLPIGRRRHGGRSTR